MDLFEAIAMATHFLYISMTRSLLMLVASTDIIVVEVNLCIAGVKDGKISKTSVKVSSGGSTGSSIEID